MVFKATFNNISVKSWQSVLIDGGSWRKPQSHMEMYFIYLFSCKFTLTWQIVLVSKHVSIYEFTLLFKFSISMYFLKSVSGTG